MHRKAQRQHVRGHAGNTSGGAAAGRDRQAENQIRGAREAMQEDGRRRGYDLREAGPHAVRDGAELTNNRPFEIDRVAQEAAVGLRHGMTAEADRLGPIGQMLAPILPIARELLGRPISGIFVQQNGEGAGNAPSCAPCPLLSWV